MSGYNLRACAFSHILVWVLKYLVLPCTGLHFLLDHEHMRLCAFCYSELPNGKESLGNGDKLSSINQSKQKA